MDRMAILPEDFDQIAVVVDWLDACRKRDLALLMDGYAKVIHALNANAKASKSIGAGEQ